MDILLDNMAKRAHGMRPPGQTLPGALQQSEMISKGAGQPRGGASAPAQFPLKEATVRSLSGGIYFTELDTYVVQDICASVFMSALIMTAKLGGKIPKCPLTGSV